MIQFQLSPIDLTGKTVLTDSRLISRASFSIFFAIKGVRHNGHLYIRELYEKGVRSFVVETSERLVAERQLDGIQEPVSVWVVNNSIRALQQAAAAYRNTFSYPVLGITGSNGKTMTKEWLAHLLEEDFRVIKSPRSYNSQIGVALSVLQMQPSHEIALFEAGISQPDEMQHLVEIIQPTIGIFTNIGTAHDEGFRSRKQKVTEKLRLFRHVQHLIYCKDHQTIQEEIYLFLKAVNPTITLHGWSTQPQGDGWSVQMERKSNLTQITLQNSNQSRTFNVPFTDEASLENATHAAIASLVLEQVLHRSWPWEAKMSELRPLAMRLELKQGIQDNYLIDDTYNNDLGGLHMALNFMNQQHTKRSKVLIVSDMLETGQPEEEVFSQMAHVIERHGIHQVFGIGPGFARQAARFPTAQIFPSTEEFLASQAFRGIHSSLVLIKGARVFAFERIVRQLVQKVHGTVFEINLDAITHNLNFYRSKVPRQTKMMAMVKASAYGSGSMEVAALLQYHRVDYLAVAYTDEGVVLRENGITLPIMVLNPQPESFQKLIDHQLEPEIFSLESFRLFIQFLQNTGSRPPYPIHLKLDTGMHRLGFTPEDLPNFLPVLKESPEVRVATLFSHLVGADEVEHNAYSRQQIRLFREMSDALNQTLGYMPLRHICNTAGILRFPEAAFDMVRLGIGLHGIEAAGIEPQALRVAGTLKTTISQIKHISAGETVGYGRKGMVDKPSRIATIAIGYADGYNRKFSQGVGQVWLNGELCPVVGNVCMDMTMIDVTHVPCEVGDEVEIFGTHIPIQTLAQTLETIPYEVLTHISERVKRVFYKE